MGNDETCDSRLIKFSIDSRKQGNFHDRTRNCPTKSEITDIGKPWRANNLGPNAAMIDARRRGNFQPPRPISTLANLNSPDRSGMDPIFGLGWGQAYKSRQGKDGNGAQRQLPIVSRLPLFLFKRMLRRWGSSGIILPRMMTETKDADKAAVDWRL